MAKLWQFSEGHPKPAFSEKVQRGDQEKFFKNRPKSILASKGQQHSGANVIILQIVSTYNAKTEKDFGAKQFQNCPKGEVMAILARSPKTRIF